MRRRVLRIAGLALLIGLVAIAAPASEPAPCLPPAWPRERLVALAAADFALAEEGTRNRLAVELLGCLEHPDPGLRDAIAFTALSTWLRSGALSVETRSTLAERLLARLEDEADAAGFRRPFAALALSEVMRADRLDPRLEDTLRQQIAGAAARSLAAVRDYRGFDAVEGWRHGVAHGADLVLQLGLHPKVSAAELRALLEAVAAQVAPAGEVSYTFGEPERLARAAFFLHQRGVLEDAFWDGWLRATGDTAPLAAWAASFETGAGLAKRHNTLAFLHALAFAARANANPASERLAELVHRELVRVMGG